MFDYIKSVFSREVGVLSANQIWYPFNDPTTPSLGSLISPKVPPKKLNFQVFGYKKGNFKKGSKDHQASCCVETMCRTVELSQRNIKSFRKPLDKWAATKSLIVKPRAGNDFNAWYDRKSLSFFYDQDPKTKKMIFTADSADIIAHEAGHAILDAMRPDFWSVPALEIWSFHEAFADIIAILTLMESDEVLEYALKETDGRLGQDNVISKLAEEMGSAIFNLTGGKGGYSHAYLRKANNTFKYQDPRNLPKQAPNNKLAAECHSFGRVFLGAWYEIMVRISYHLKHSKSDIEALKEARDVMSLYLFKAIPRTPRTSKYYQAIAKSMMDVDRQAGSPYGKIMRKVFEGRKILPQEVRMLSKDNEGLNWKDFKKGVEPQDNIFKHKDGLTYISKSNHVVKLSDYVVSGLSGDNPLFDVEIELAQDGLYEFDKSGNLIEEIVPNGTEAMDDALHCLNAIQDEELIGNAWNSMWEVKDGKLERSHIR